MPEIRPAGVSVQPYQYVKKNFSNIRKVSIPVEQNNQPKGMSKRKEDYYSNSCRRAAGIGALVITRGKAAKKPHKRQNCLLIFLRNCKQDSLQSKTLKVRNLLTGRILNLLSIWGLKVLHQKR